MEHRETEGDPATRDREAGRDDRPRDPEADDGPRTDARRDVPAEERRRDEFGGFNFGAAFLGWLAAVGLGALLVALLSAAGAAIGLTETDEAALDADAETISVAGAVLLILVVGLAYYVGGYVAGRMSRFDGGRQGLGVWVIGLVVTVLLAALGAIAEAEYNLLAQLDLPRIPIEEGDLATGGAITLALLLLVTAAAAVLGGKLGERYHVRVDEAGYTHRR